MHSSPINIARLNLFTDGDAGEERELAKLFLEQAHQMIMLLEQSMGEHAQEMWKCTVHRFKGSAGNLGAEQLQELCVRAEMISEPQKKSEMLAAIKRETRAVESFFNRPRIQNLGRTFVGHELGPDSDEETFLL